MRDLTTYYCPKCQNIIYQNIAWSCPFCYSKLLNLCSKYQWENTSDEDRKALIARKLHPEESGLPQQPEETPDDSGTADTGQSVINSSHIRCGDDTHSQPHSPAPLILGLFGAAFFIIAGVNILCIQSQATANGDTGSIAEAFYNSMGYLSFGLACLSATVGYIGWKCG